MISSRQAYETYAANKDDDNLKYWGSDASEGDDEFAVGETTRYVNKPDYRLSDLGIGKFIPIQYPWNPQNSPNLCKEAGKADSQGYPAPDCDEFVFTRS